MCVLRVGRSLPICSPILVAITLACAAGTLSAQQTSPPAASETSDPTELFDRFAKALDNVVLEGQFTIDGRDDPPRKERYEIRQVTKAERGDYWIFQTRIAYGEHDVTLPLPLQVKWAGRTPVITLDQVTIPALGTFDARVVIDGQRYAGTWQHGDVGGHLFGTIRKLEPAPPGATAPEQP